MQSLTRELEGSRKRANDTESELKIVQRQMERMRDAIAPGSSTSNVGALVEENTDLKESIRNLKHRVSCFSLQLGHNVLFLASCGYLD